MKNLNQLMLHAKNGNYGLNIYISNGGKEYYLSTRRPCGLLWTKLKDGVTLGELKRIKPGYTRAGQKYYHYSPFVKTCERLYQIQPCSVKEKEICLC
ncbi:hypothetical protein FACS1894127_7760 [Clostridia bacterium]|nr:hypothetical protein FACS1894127_7760 [Clostridia bacterium]